MFKLCKNDPLLSMLQKTFAANIVRIPRAGIEPLEIILKKKNSLKALGQLKYLLVGNPDLSEIEVDDTAVASLQNTQTGSMEASFGLQLLKGYLEGFGVAGADVSATFKKATEMSLSFPNPIYKSISALQLGSIVRDYVVDVDNPVAKTFVGEDSVKVLIIDSVMCSAKFSTTVEKAVDNSFNFDIGEIKGILDMQPGRLTVKKESSSTISFEGTDPLCFAFSCIQFSVDPATGRLKDFKSPEGTSILENKKKRTRIYPRSNVAVDI